MLMDMKTYTHLNPGQKGTRRLIEKFGDSLLRVRYRYDEKRGVRLKTVEIIVEERPCTSSFRYRDTDVVAVMIPDTGKTLREILKAVGDRWDLEEKLWQVRYGVIRSHA